MQAWIPVERPALLVLLSRHSGERLELTRFEGRDGPWLEIRGSLPARSEAAASHPRFLFPVIVGLGTPLDGTAGQVGPGARLGDREPRTEDSETYNGSSARRRFARHLRDVAVAPFSTRRIDFPSAAPPPRKCHDPSAF